jgi:hypothetical protein
MGRLRRRASPFKGAASKRRSHVMNWLLLIQLASTDPFDHLRMETLEEVHVSRLACEFARDELRIARGQVLTATCFEVIYRPLGALSPRRWRVTGRAGS